jgi:hypothetical protein
MAKKLSKLVGIIAIAMTCTAISASAQGAFYTSFGGGVSLVKDNVSPVYSVRLGMDVDLVFAEVEGSYLSMKQNETNTLSTMTMGANVGLKFLSGYYGYLAVMLNTGYALQEDRHHGYCYDPCWGYDYGRHRYHGKYYIGAGVKGNVFLSDRISLFGEARYQSIPIDGGGRNKWGGIFQGGISFYF